MAEVEGGGGGDLSRIDLEDEGVEAALSAWHVGKKETAPTLSYDFEKRHVPAFP